MKVRVYVRSRGTFTLPNKIRTKARIANGQGMDVKVIGDGVILLTRIDGDYVDTKPRGRDKKRDH
jgi:bifunctional DNA-binding transcriptional regulator/antitoxin component of YhaV-PrlF toxin-antitoxin module